MPAEAKRFWLSFTDPGRPRGEQFLGVCIVEVTADDAAAARATIANKFPHAKPGAEWIGAAMHKAHEMGCNPGGEVATYELPATAADVPLNQLLSRAQLKELRLT